MSMRKLLYLFLILFVGLSACTHLDYPRLMAAADSLLYIRPDSALTILYGIPPDELDSADRARHALLTVEAECRNGVAQPYRYWWITFGMQEINIGKRGGNTSVAISFITM